MITLIFFGFRKQGTCQNKEISNQLFEKVEYKLSNYDFNDLLWLDTLVNSNPNSNYLLGINTYYVLMHMGKQKDYNIFNKKINKYHLNQNNTFILLAKGALELKKHNEEKATRNFHKSLKADKFKINKWVRFELYHIYKEIDSIKSLLFLKDALNIDKEFSAAQLVMSYVLFNKGKTKKALSIIDNVINRNNYFYAYVEKGNIYFKQQDYKNAKRNYLKSLNIKENAYAYFYLGDIEYYYKNYQQAINFYEKSLKTNLLDTNFYYNEEELLYYRIGLSYMELEDYKNAKLYYLKALEKNINEDYYLSIIYIDVLLKEYKSAKETLNILIKKIGESRDTFFWDIMLFAIKGQTELGQAKVIEFYEKYNNDDTEWLEKELNAWGIKIIKQ